MRHALVLSQVLHLIATGAPAQTLMTPDEFDAWSTGKIVDYSLSGADRQVYSREEHFPDRRTRLLIDGDCAEGVWHAEGDAVCFVYPAYEGLHCWHFWREGDAVLALPTGSLPDSLPDLVTPSDIPLACPGPDVGV
jgi:hypothetical protein